MDTYKKPTSSAKLSRTPASTEPSATPPQRTAPTKKGARWLTIAIVVIVLFVLALGIGYKTVYKGGMASLPGVNQDQYQALFLTNGQVYFGKLEKADKSTIKISDIYYLQVQQPVQPAEDGEAAEGETQLIKLGEELHGPEDEMFIDRGQVLFWENLKDSGRVVEAIREHKRQ